MTTNHKEDDLPMFARGGVRGPFGNLDEELKTKIDFETAMEFRRLVNEAGTDASGALRDWVYLTARGKTYTDFCVHEAKIKSDKLFGTGHEQALIKARQ